MIMFHGFFAARMIYFNEFETPPFGEHHQKFYTNFAVSHNKKTETRHKGIASVVARFRFCTETG